MTKDLTQTTDKPPLKEDSATIELLPDKTAKVAGLLDCTKKELLPPPRLQEVVPYDPLRAYLREIRRYPPLSREEEHELAVRYKEHNDLDAVYKLITSNLWLVVKITRDYEKAARSILDLIQEGNIGLMEAVKNFDPYRGVRLPSYAVWWIRAYLVRYIIANWRMVKIGTTQAQRRLFFNLKKEKERLEREGFSPEPKLLAEKLNVKESEVIEMEQRLSTPDLSVDAPLQNDPDTPLLSLFPSETETAEEILSNVQLKAQISLALKDFLDTLNPNEAIIYQERLLSEEKATLQDLSEKLSLSRERVRQIENRIKEKLKVFILERFGDNLEAFEF
ncbi:MAG: RNA polymerase factor sigma-32 [Bdellovibrionota bacterium]|jgi:RNA polymerase sigma-32 factor